MIDQHTAKFDLRVRTDSKRVRTKQTVRNEDMDDQPVKIERLSKNVLAMSIHRDQLQSIIDVFKGKGVEPYRCIDNDTSAGEYELLYIASENPDLDIIRYQRILDSAA